MLSQVQDELQRALKREENAQELMSVQNTQLEQAQLR